MINNPLLGKLLSEHKLADYRRTGMMGCGVFLLLPLIFGLWSLIASLTYAKQTSDVDEGFYFSIALVGGCIVLFGLLALPFFVAPLLLKKYGLEIYENGFVKKDLFKTQTCQWSEIREVNPMVLIFDGRKPAPSDFGSIVADTKIKGMYEVYKKDGQDYDKSTLYRHRAA